jgi:hypothetical protein
MNNLKTTDLGGFPFNLDDWRFQVEEIKSLTQKFAELGLGGINFIVSGCELTDTGTNWELSAGVVMLNGELRRVRPGSLPKNTATKFGIQEINEPSSNVAATKIFQNGDTFNVWELREAVFSTIPVFDNRIGLVEGNTSTSIDGLPIQRLDFRRALIFATTSNWFNLIDIGDFTDSRYIEGSRVPQARITPSGIQLRGDIGYDDLAQINTSIKLFDFTRGTIFNPNKFSISANATRHLAVALSDTDNPYLNVLLEVNQEQITLRGDIIEVPSSTSGTFMDWSLDGIIITF